MASIRARRRFGDGDEEEGLEIGSLSVLGYTAAKSGYACATGWEGMIAASMGCHDMMFFFLWIFASLLGSRFGPRDWGAASKPCSWCLSGIPGGIQARHTREGPWSLGGIGGQVHGENGLPCLGTWTETAVSNEMRWAMLGCKAIFGRSCHRGPTITSCPSIGHECIVTAGRYPPPTTQKRASIHLGSCRLSHETR